jgi:cellulose synthase/poly-beta-1,6-N-acetylglucosamine synthase-like glycosyltransferase
MLNKLTICFGAAGSAALLLLFPMVHAALLAVNFVAHFFVLGLQLVTACLPRTRLPRRKAFAEEPFVSIHVPACNEPPELLRQTLESLSRLHWRNYEVLVIDNNTADEAVWRPVEACCEKLGPRFRFFHVEQLAGFKAGALNYVRQFMNSQAEYIFVVDADYTVRRNALRRGLRYFTDPKIGLVQFPQDYRNIGPGNLGIALDFKHYFSGYMTMANTLDCVPSTGTLSLINVAALKAVGGFDPSTITEDADLGFRLSLQGYQSVYVNETIGQGVMPHDLESLKKQRWRWAFGNAQILKLNWRHIVFGRELTRRQRLGFLAHLTAWFNFTCCPACRSSCWRRWPWPVGSARCRTTSSCSRR